MLQHKVKHHLKCHVSYVQVYDKYLYKRDVTCS